MAHYRAGRRGEAESVCRRVLSAQPGNVDALRLLAAVLRETGRAGEAVEHLTAACRHRPSSTPLAGELGMTLVLASRHEEAIPLLESVARAMPRSPQAHFWLGRAHLDGLRSNKAARCFQAAYDCAPDNAELMSMIGVAMLSAGRGADAEPWLRRYAERRPESALAHSNLAAALNQQGRHEEAEACLHEALRLDPSLENAIAALARHLRRKGEYEEAFRVVEEAVGRLGPRPHLASAYAELCERHGKVEEGVGVVRSALASGKAPAQQGIGLWFTLARLLEAAGDDEAAWDAYVRGNDLYPRGFRAEAKRRFTDEMIATFSEEAMRSLPRASEPCDLPVFVVGMPRSGTTLIEQIIASHPEAVGAGEMLVVPRLCADLARRLRAGWPGAMSGLTPDLVNDASRRYVEALREIAPDARRVVDKLPHNFEALGLINLILPKAHVIHCTRDPMDTCVSCYLTPLSPMHNYRSRLDDLGFAYNEYLRLMEHWRRVLDVPMMSVAYEDLVGDVESAARRIIEFIGLPWDDRCLRFHENARSVSTASVDQVRRPIYTTSVARWKRYEAHLGPLKEALARGGTPTP